MSVPVCRQIYTIRMAAVYASLFHYFSRGTESLCGTVSYMGFEKFAGWTGMFTPDCPAIPEYRLGVIPGILHIRPCGAGSEPVVYPSLCRHAVRPSRVRSHRTYSLSGLISSLRVMTRDSDRACSLFRGKPSQKPLTIPVRKRHDRPDGLPESDSGIQGIRTHDNMPRLLLHCHDPLLRVAAKTETVSSKRVHRQSSLPFAAALLLLIPVLFGR